LNKPLVIKVVQCIFSIEDRSIEGLLRAFIHSTGVITSQLLVGIHDQEQGTEACAKPEQHDT
jgi:hypothetical protein